MNWQLAAVELLVAVAGAYLAAMAWRTIFGVKPGCGSGCGKCSAAESVKPGRSALPQVD